MRALPLALLLLAPLLAGCTLFPTDKPPPIDARLVREVFVVPDARLRMDSPYGSVRVDGRGLAVPVVVNGTEVGAVYLGVQGGWRADAIIGLRQREGIPADLFVEAPQGAWARLRADQGWQPANATDLQALGYADDQSLLAKATRVLPPTGKNPEPSTWLFNGTIAGLVAPTNVTFVVEREGPLVFSRGEDRVVIAEGRSLLSWTPSDRTLDASNDGLVRVAIHDPGLAELRVAWTNASVDVRVKVPPFRESHLVREQDPRINTTSVTFPDVALVTMTRHTSVRIDDDHVEMRTRNMTLLMAPDA